MTTNTIHSPVQINKAPRGFFVDWNGDTRRTDCPGDDYHCIVDVDRKSVEVCEGDGGVIYEATFFMLLQDVEDAGVAVNLVPK